MRYNVLIVDDSKLARMVMASAFRRIRPDWTLVEATSADGALDALQAARWTSRWWISICPNRWTGADRQDRKTRPDMPVAVVSANLQDEIVARARELNAGFVPKPLTDESLGAFLSGAALRLKKANNEH